MDAWRKNCQREREAYVDFPDRHPPSDPLWTKDPSFMPIIINLCYFTAIGDPTADPLLKGYKNWSDEGSPFHIGAVVRSMGRIAEGERNWYRLCEAEDLNGPEASVVLQVLEILAGTRNRPGIPMRR